MCRPRLSLPSAYGQGIRLAARGTAQGAWRLGRLLPRLRRRAALVRAVRVGSAGRVPGVRRRPAPSLPELRRAVLVDRGRRLRGVRQAGARRRALRLAYSAQALEQVVVEAGHDRPAEDLREADDRDDVVRLHIAVVELAEERRHLVGAADLGVVVLDLA